MQLLKKIRFALVTLLAAGATLSAFSLPAQAQKAGDPKRDLVNINKMLNAVAPGQKVLAMDDMLFPVERLRAYRDTIAARVSGGIQPRFSQSNTATKWPNGIVYYEYSLGVRDDNRVLFEKACRIWEGIANVRFVPATTGNRLFVIQSGVNSSYVGMVGVTDETPDGRQQINIKDWGWENIICHELAHALGIIHEHCRSDRDSYVTVHFENIIPGYQNNFLIVPGSLNPVTYDFESIMQYASTAFGITTPSYYTYPTIVPLPQYERYTNRMGQRYVMSELDKAGMRALYGSLIPFSPLAVTAAAKSTTSIEVAWQKNGKNTSGIQVQRSPFNADFVKIADLGADATSYVDSGLTINTKYYYRLIATNANGSSAPSNVASATTLRVISPPAVTISSPASASAFANMPVLTGKVVDKGGSGIARVEVTLKRSDGLYWTGYGWGESTPLASSIDAGGNWKVDSGLPTSETDDVTQKLFDGLYSVTAKAVDNNGDSATATVQFSFDATAPATIYITSPVLGSFMRNLPTVSGMVSDGPEGSGIDRVEVFLKRADNSWWTGTVWGASTALATTLGSGDSWKVSSALPSATATEANKKLSDGNYQLSARAFDRAGNSTETFCPFIVDNTAPVNVTITNPANRSQVVSLSAISGTAADGPTGSGITKVAVYLWRAKDNTWWNGNGWGAMTSLSATLGGGNTWKLDKGLPKPSSTDFNSMLGTGYYQVRVEAFDRTGNSTRAASEFKVVAPYLGFRPGTAPGEPIWPVEPGMGPLTTSPVTLSSITATPNALTLVFNGRLDSSATDLGRYRILLNNAVLPVESVSLTGAGMVVNLALPSGKAKSGDAVEVTWNLKDFTFRNVKGTETVTVR